jgi:hypothetical protein
MVQRDLDRIGVCHGVTIAVAIRHGFLDQYKYSCEANCREELWLQLAAPTQ